MQSLFENHCFSSYSLGWWLGWQTGLAQTGAWACLDEFNRIEVEVLSVVATQIAVVMNAIKGGKATFVFEGVEIRLIPSCGIFVTMNPGNEIEYTTTLFSSNNL